jgi:hypothetical protein
MVVVEVVAMVPVATTVMMMIRLTICPGLARTVLVF